MVHLFVATLGFSRRQFVAAYQDQSQRSWMDGMERAFHHFEGIPRTVLMDNAKALVDRPRNLDRRYHLGAEDLLRGSDLADGQNIFGEPIELYLESYSDGQDLVMEYHLATPSMETCRRILEHLGEVTEVVSDMFKIEPGKTISGYVGGDQDANPTWAWRRVIGISP